MTLALVTLAYVAVGAIAGVLATLFGFGGGFVVVPVVLWHMSHQGLGDDAATHIAIATSLAVMIGNALNATQAHARRGTVRWDIYAHMAPYVALGAIVGVLGAGHLGGAILRWIFVAFLGYTVLFALIRKDLIDVETERFDWPSITLRGLFGTTVGVVAGALGVGGSVLTVPFLRRRGLAMKQAAALASPLSLPVSIAGTATVLVLGSQGWNTPAGSLELIYLAGSIRDYYGHISGCTDRCTYCPSLVRPCVRGDLYGPARGDCGGRRAGRIRARHPSGHAQGQAGRRRGSEVVANAHLVVQFRQHRVWRW